MGPGQASKARNLDMYIIAFVSLDDNIEFGMKSFMRICGNPSCNCPAGDIYAPSLRPIYEATRVDQ